MNAEILACGTEILMGEIVDTNSPYIAARLPALGIELDRVMALPDDLHVLADAFRHAWRRSDITFATGGLGPTRDDLTREAIAEALGEELTVDPTLLAWQKEFWASRNVPMPESNIKQALLIPSAQPLPNPRGTAPGWWVQKNGHAIVVMPGVPPEFHYMWQNEVVPRLLKLERGQIILSRALKTYGQSESGLNDRLHALFGRENPYLGIYAKPDGIHLRIIAKAPNETDARALIAPMEREILQLAGDIVWGYDDETPEERLGDALRRLKASLATMESCTGGLLASIVTDVPGSSDYYHGGFITYTAEAKIAQGVSASVIEQHGVVSTQVAEAMAQAARRSLHADYGIGVTGVAGPDPLDGVPPGTVHIGFAWEGGSSSRTTRMRFDRQTVKRRTATQAMLEMRRVVLEHPPKR
ncbi:MAG: competence/damage-inducible protein A [Dehalococcoidia bacterium]|nr:competence/damage-inducible protein A [Dehalococcoidia bacterium]